MTSTTFRSPTRRARHQSAAWLAALLPSAAFRTCALCAVLLAVATGCEKTDGVSQGGSDNPTSASADDMAPVAPEAANPVIVTLETTKGDIVLELDPDLAPLTVENFLTYVKDGYYDGVVFHRVVPGELIQSGKYGTGMESRKDRWREPIPSEANNGLANMRGTIAMARKDMPNTATAEFFINVSDNAGRLDNNPGKTAGYTVFGRVIKGLTIVDEIAKADISTHPQVGAGQVKCVPKSEIAIRNASMKNLNDLESVGELAAAKRELLDFQKRQRNKTETDWIDDFVKQTEEMYGLKFEETDDGWLYMDLAKGIGPEPIQGGGVQFAYTGKLLKGLTVFETNVNAPFLNYYELDRLIPGLRMALESMQVGGKRIAIIPPKLAFGEDGIPRGTNPIPPNATLVYDLELLDIKAPE